MPDTPAQPDLEPVPCPGRTPGEVVDALERLSKRGKLAGFERRENPGGDQARGERATFVATAQGTPFDRELIGRVEQTENGSRIAWSVQTAWRMPAVFAAALVVSVWPGLPVTDSMLVTYSSWYAGVVSEDGWFRTWMWYLPLTVPFVPLAWKAAMGKSRTTSLAHAREVADAVRAALAK